MCVCMCTEVPRSGSQIPVLVYSVYATTIKYEIIQNRTRGAPVGEGGRSGLRIANRGLRTGQSFGSDEWAGAAASGARAAPAYTSE